MKQSKQISIMSFGFKYGEPPAAALVRDMRWVKNPFYEPELRLLTGADQPVQQFIMAQPGVQVYLNRLQATLKVMVKDWLAQGAISPLVLAFGCTGGKHRSRFFALRAVDIINRILADLDEKGTVTLSHRELGKE
jgi:UPF0042 nucleotide-binding protein